MRIYLPGPQPETRGELARRYADFALRCTVTALAGAAVACLIIGFAGAVTVIGDALVTAALP